jgi:signal transduction histidine kinase
MAKKNLASILKLQWWLHTLLTMVFFIFLTFFLLFVFEDYVNEKQLSDMGNIVASNKFIKGLPEQIKLYAINEVPQYWTTQLEHLALNKVIEINDRQGGPIHLLRSQFVESKTEFVLAFDTTKARSVWDLSDELLIFLLPWMILFLALASFMAKKFTRQIQWHFERLLATINQSKSPSALKQYSKTQSIDELAQFAQLFAEVWQQKIEILAREKQGLEYLGHELRTPIQASLATLELLALKTADKKIIERLSRSLKRMTRLSNTILYLMESKRSLPTYPVDVFKICQELVAELQPLADMKKQIISMDTGVSAVKIVATQEVIETLLSILLTNALQHSNNSPINITLSNHQISIQNEVKQVEPPPSSTVPDETYQSLGVGFSIGLKIAQRLADNFNLQLSILFDKQKQVIATISSHVSPLPHKKARRTQRETQ